MEKSIIPVKIEPGTSRVKTEEPSIAADETGAVKIEKEHPRVGAGEEADSPAPTRVKTELPACDEYEPTNGHGTGDEHAAGTLEHQIYGPRYAKIQAAGANVSIGMPFRNHDERRLPWGR